MADDLEDEWWLQNDDQVVPEVPGGKSGETEKDVKTKKQKGKKRPASPDITASDDEPPTKKKAQAVAKETKSKTQEKGKDKNKKKGKKKKSSKIFVKRKITDEDEENLNKSGTPEDVIALLTAKLKGSDKTAKSDSDDDDSDGDDHTLSADDDFLTENEGQQPSEYLSESIPGWEAAVKKVKLEPGSPMMLILCSSAVRAVQLKRDVKSFLGKDCKTAKLFAKHMKLEEQKKFLKKNICHAGIGTPNRVQALLESGDLKVDRLHFVVLDWNWRDVKLKRMVDVPDIKRDLSVLLKQFIVDRVKNTPCRIAVL